MSDFAGITRLARSRELHWANIWAHESWFALTLKPKGGGSAACRCELFQNTSSDPGEYRGTLQVGGTAYQVLLWEDSDCLRIHFAPEEGGEP
jgi:hypothetical protein